MTTLKDHKHPFYKSKVFLWTVGAVAGIIVCTLLAFRISPWPGALLIRTVFESNNAKATKALEKHAPSTPIVTVKNQQYIPGDKDAYLDVYIPSSPSKELPLVIWTHGGAWVSGGREDNATYYKLLAAQGFAVASLGYSRGPEKTYPTAVHQINEAHRYLSENASRLHINSSQIFLAGDSAGAQLSSQMAAIITNPLYAKTLKIAPTLSPQQLHGVVLNCGIYRMDELVKPDVSVEKIIGWGMDVSVWAYSGTRDTNSPILREMSAQYHVTKDFPATYISGGNGDGLTKGQSVPFADKLDILGVQVVRHFFADDHQPMLPHEYQFNLDTDDGKIALEKTVDFLKERSQTDN